MSLRSGTPLPRLRIAGVKIRLGEARRIEIPLTETYAASPVALPVTVVRAERPGPTVLVTAAAHGDELNGVEVVLELMDAVTPDRLRLGTLICAPVLNVPGFMAGERYLPDGRDLNREFPGQRNGSSASRIASLIFRELVRKADRLIDLHTASRNRTNVAHVRGDLSDPATRRLARAFGCEILVHASAPRGSLRRAAAAIGVPAILFEAGEANRFQRDMVERGVRGVLRVLAVERMIAASPAPRPAFRVIVKKAVWVRARRGGILDLRVRPGDLVYEGDPIAITRTPFGEKSDVIAAPATGLVLGLHTVPLANPGNAICHLVKLRKGLETVRRALAAEGRAPSAAQTAAAAATGDRAAPARPPLLPEDRGVDAAAGPADGAEVTA